MQSEYWNPKIETVPRPELEALQAMKLRESVRWAKKYSVHYARTLAEVDESKGVEMLQRLPLLTRAEWMDSQAAAPPFGELPVAGPDRAVRVHTTSGTTGREPLRVLDTFKDWSWCAEMWDYGLWAMGIRPGDVAYIAFGYGSFIGFWGLHYGLEKLGALVVPGGAQPTDRRVRQIVDFGATVVASTPTYAIRLAQEAETLGINLPASSVRALVLSGEPAGSIPETKALIEKLWGAKAYDTAGMSEVGTIVTFECSHQPGGTHIIEDHFIEEVIDPDRGEPVGYGELGERVVTSFGRAILPLIRYRTSDLVVKVPAERCACGRTFDIYDGGIRGRVDDMKVVRGTNVYPRAVEAIVRGCGEVDEFQVHLTRGDDHLDVITLRVELGPGVNTIVWPEIETRLRKELAEAHEGLRFEVERAEAGALPRFDLKARRLVDDRSVPGVKE